MPTLAIILLVYYVVGTVVNIALGPRSVVYTPLKAAVYIVLMAGISVAWLSLPVCGALPLAIWILLGFLWFLNLIALLAIGEEVYITPGNIAITTLITMTPIIFLLTLNYC
jgi:hypothetical protein